ncbi:MAG: hypothetical protein ACFE0Q_19065 [Anaerolineae bacterium]
MTEPVNIFKTIVVPIARPDTPPHMLEIATSLVDPDGAKAYALTVAINDAGQNRHERRVMAYSNNIDSASNAF